jgi:hypothetical protein
MSIGIIGLLSMGIVPAARSFAASGETSYDLDFEIPEVESKEVFKIWGYSEFRPFLRVLDKNSALYKQKYAKNPQNAVQTNYLLNLRPEMSFDYGQIGAYARPRLDVDWSEVKSGSLVLDEPSEQFWENDAHWGASIMLEEGFVTWRPSPSFTAEAGKKVLNWGKGYAWNPVAFASRPKDVDDPDHAREGYVMSYLDYIRSFDGPLKTLAVTPLVLPVADRLNAELASGDSLLFGGKIYALLYDIDLDLMFMAGDNYDTRIGFDFSTNLTSNLEIHGESAIRFGYNKNIIDTDGEIRSKKFDALNFLVGLRYLNSLDTTIIVEYYHNGEGYSPGELRDYYDLINDGYDEYIENTTNSALQRNLKLLKGNAQGQSSGSSSGNETSLLQDSSQVADTYNKSTAGQDYLYLRISQKEPFDILFLTPTVTLITNLGDLSCSLNPEISYMIIPNLELKPRLVIPLGPPQSEFGEKMNSFRGEFRVTYYF